jgi:hypothetical protein
MFYGIAIGGNKGNGKDFVLDYLCATRPDHQIVRCKTPIVERYEKIVGHAYNKGRDDAELIEISATQIRGGPHGNDQICKDYLIDVVPDVIESGKLVFIPDMRRVPENEAARDHLNLMCMYVWASEETRKRRTISRDGDLRNYKPDDDTEREVEHLRYHYIVDNDRDDGGWFAFQQIEGYLARCGTRFRRANREIVIGSEVRCIAPERVRYFDKGTVIKAGVGPASDMCYYHVRYADSQPFVLESSADLLVVDDSVKGAA